jgi:hypothetical protein
VLKTLLAGKSADDDDLRAFCSSPFAKATEMEQFQDLLLAAHCLFHSLPHTIGDGLSTLQKNYRQVLNSEEF